MDVLQVTIMLFALVFSVIFHEMAHAWSALMMGDPTGKNDNRLSWNPIHHIDPWMTIILPAILLASSGGRFAFGGAKPVQINPLNFKNPGRGMMISAACGPFSNFLLAVVALGLLYLMYCISPDMVAKGDPPAVTLGGFFLMYTVLINLILGAFNLVPIPPLDGSRILRYLLPAEGKLLLDRIEPFGLWIILLVLMVGGFGRIIAPVYMLYWNVLIGLFDPSVAGAFYNALIG